MSGTWYLIPPRVVAAKLILTTWRAEQLMGIMSMDDITGGTAGVASGLKIGSFNCNGLGNTAKRNSVLTWLKGKPEDIIFVQEAHSTPHTESAWKRAWGGEVIFNHV